MSERRITLFLLDNDPIFRLGLNTALETFPDLEVLVQGNRDTILPQLQKQQPDILIVDPVPLGWQPYQHLKQDYPQVKICIFSGSLPSRELLTIQAAGVEGYCLKGSSIEELVQIIRQIARGKKVWPPPSTSRLSLRPERRQQLIGRLIQPGLNQIEQNIVLVNNHLKKRGLSWLDWFFWTGRRRELLAARWLVRRLLPPDMVKSPPQDSPPAVAPAPTTNGTALPVLQSLSLPTAGSSGNAGVAAVLENTLTKIQGGVENKTSIALEIDILQADKRRELLYLVFTKFRQIISEFPTQDTDATQLQDKLVLLLQEIWAESLRLFLEIYYPDKAELNRGLIDELIGQEMREISKNILVKIAFSQEIFTYFMYQNKLKIDRIEYSAHTPEAIARAEILLHNLVITIANAVTCVILNNFFEQEKLIEKLFNARLKSAREIAKFRNNLSWQYRQQKYWQEPKAIFESKYNLLYLDGRQINQTCIDNPRQKELQQLTGLPWGVTIALEVRDAIAPRLRAMIALVGQGLVYVLTQVIGRGIGLIGRGIIQGVGSTFQEVRYGKNSKQ